jgi:hypothetical protein
LNHTTKFSLSYFEMVYTFLNLKSPLSQTLHGFWISFDLNKVRCFKFYFWAKSIFYFWKDFKTFLITFPFFRNVETFIWIHIPSQIQISSILNFFVLTQIILGLEFKNRWFEPFNQCSNSYFWRSSNFSLEFKILSNPFEFIQINNKIFRKEFNHFSNSWAISAQLGKAAQPSSLLLAHLPFPSPYVIWPREPH